MGTSRFATPYRLTNADDHTRGIIWEKMDCVGNAKYRSRSVLDDGYLSTHNTRLLRKSDIRPPVPSIAPLPSVLVGQILISTGGKIDFNRWQDFGMGVRGLFVEIATLRRNFENVRSFDRPLIYVAVCCSLPSKDLGYRDIYPTVDSDAIFPSCFLSL